MWILHPTTLGRSMTTFLWLCHTCYYQVDQNLTFCRASYAMRWQGLNLTGGVLKFTHCHDDLTLNKD